MLLVFQLVLAFLLGGFVASAVGVYWLRSVLATPDSAKMIVAWAVRELARRWCPAVVLRHYDGGTRVVLLEDLARALHNDDTLPAVPVPRLSLVDDDDDDDPDDGERRAA